MSLLASQEFLVELTDCKRSRDQIAWLKKRGYPFEVSGAGRPKVLMAEIEARMRSHAEQDQESPDFTDIAA